MTTQQIIGPVHFKLKDAKDYSFWGRGNLRRLEMKAGEIVTMTSKADIDYFRARQDVIVECTPEGVPMDDLGRKGHLVPGKPKSYKVFGRPKRGAPQPVASPASPASHLTPKVERLNGTPKVVRLGGETRLAPKVVRVGPQPEPTPTLEEEFPGLVAAHVPAETAPSPIEHAQVDGTTEAVGPQADPGQPTL